MRYGTFRKFALLLSIVALAGFVGGCKKKVAAQPPAPAPAPPAAKPTVTLNASPTSVTSGQTVTLSWSSTNATDLDLGPGVGKVAPEGSTPVTPTQSTTFTITVTGPGGSSEASARVDVTQPAPVAEQPAVAPDINELFEQNVKDAFFDFNKSDVRADAREALTKDAEFLRSYPEVKISLEGHCDERGSTEYNLGLGARRSEAAKNYLITLGIGADRLTSMSWGKEHLFCGEHTEDCWQQNRRAHFVMTK
jgi:peptidoglycan-associated lipoprotein